jgi:hypothetical protein
MTMKKSLFALLATAATLPAFADNDCTFYPQNEWMPQSQLTAQLEKEGYTIHRMKVDDNCYEMRGLNAKGERVEIDFDVKSGKPVKTEIHH